MAYKFVARRRRDRAASSVPSASLSGSRMTDQQKLAGSIANQQTRLQSVGETPKELDKTPALIKVLNALDKARSTFATGLQSAQEVRDKAAGITAEDRPWLENVKRDPFGALGGQIIDPLALRKLAADALQGKNVVEGVKSRMDTEAEAAKAFLSGMKTGWEQGDAAVTGREMVDYGAGPMLTQEGQAGNKAEKAAREIAGFGVEIFTDPLNLVTTGAGTLLKGVSTKGTGKMTREVAEGVARAQLSRATGVTAERAAGKRITKELVEEAAQRELPRVLEATPGIAQEAAEKQATKMAKDMLKKQAIEAETADRIAAALKKAGVKDGAATVDDAAKLIADAKVAAASRTAGKGLSIGGKTLVAEEKLLKAGGAIRAGLDKVTPIRKTLEFGDMLFNPKYIAGASAAAQEVMHGLKQAMTRRKGALDTKTAEMFARQAKVVADEGKKVARAFRAQRIEELDRYIIHALEGTRLPDEIPAPIAKVANEMREHYKQMGVEGYEAGILHSVMHDRYAPRILAEDSVIKQAKGGSVKGNLKVTSPAAAKREAGPTLEIAQNRMRYAKSDTDAQEAFVEALYRHFGAEPPKTQPGRTTAVHYSQIGKITDSLADDWKHKLMKQGYDEDSAAIETLKRVEDAQQLYDQVGLSADVKTFSESGLASFLTRSLQHNRVLAAKEFVDDAVAAFGTPVRSQKQAYDLAKTGKDVVITRQSLKHGVLLQAGQADELADIGEALGATREAQKAAKLAVDDSMVDEIPHEIVETAITKLSPEMQTLVKTLLDGNADSLIKITPEQWDLLTGEGSALLARPVVTEAYAFDPAILQSILSVSAKQTDTAMQALGRGIDMLYAKWKPLVTGLKLVGYNLRNLAGGTFNNVLDVGLRALDPATAAKAAMVQAKRAGQVLPGYTGKELWDIAIEKGIMHGTHATEFSESATRATEKRLYGTMRGGVGAKARAAADTVLEGSKRVSNAVEGQLRLTNFIANVEVMTAKGVPIEQAFDLAADSVRKFQFDYTDLSEPERQFFRRLIPFYSWMRNNIPLQLEQALNQPGTYAAVARMQKDFAPEADKEALPGYMQETMAVPIPGTGTEQGAAFANLNLPAQDLMNLEKPGKTLLTSLNPLAKVAIELPLNKNILTGGPIWKDSDPPDAKKQKIINYLLQQFGVLGTAARSGVDAASGAEKAPPGTKPVEALAPGLLGDLTGLSSILKQYNITPAELQDQYNLNTLLKNQIAQTEAERDIEVPTMADLKKQGYQYVPRRQR